MWRVLGPRDAEESLPEVTVRAFETRHGARRSASPLAPTWGGGCHLGGGKALGSSIAILSLKSSINHCLQVITGKVIPLSFGYRTNVISPQCSSAFAPVIQAIVLAKDV
jgi:hypothetical protein